MSVTKFTVFSRAALQKWGLIWTMADTHKVVMGAHIAKTFCEFQSYRRFSGNVSRSTKSPESFPSRQNSCWQCSDNGNDNTKLNNGDDEAWLRNQQSLCSRWLSWVADPWLGSHLILVSNSVHQNWMIMTLLSFSPIAGHVQCQPLAHFEGREPASLRHYCSPLADTNSHLFRPYFQSSPVTMTR